MKVSVRISGLLAAAIISGCAQQPSQITAAEVSRNAYSTANCSTLTKQLHFVETQLGRLSAEQKAEADKDAAWVAGGALLFFPAMVVAAAGEDHAGEIAILKGKKNAISEQMIIANCY